VHRIVLLACGLPALYLVWALWETFGAMRTGPPPLGANPVEALERDTGIWALRFLVASLAVTPLRRLGWRTLAPYRRTLGLTAFFYACLHVTTFVALDLGFDLGAVAEDVIKRPYITVGFAAFCILFLLAITSTRAAMKRLGRHWTTLHRGIYVAAICAVVHFTWLVKADYREPLVYGAIVAILLIARVRARRRPAG
jgi:sulfoxide reductase heme-binding subunit YedZ